MRPSHLARFVGVVYLIQTFVGSFPLYVRSQLIVANDASKTAANILNAETLFRFGLLSEVAVSFTWFAIAYLLYSLFADRHRRLSLLFLVMVVVGISTLTANSIFLASTLDLLTGTASVSGFDAGQSYSLAMMLLAQFGRGEAAWGLWAGLWLIPLGVIVSKGVGVPKVFGPLLILASLGYALPVIASFILPGLKEPLRWLIVYSGLAELSWGIWLLVKGVDERAIAPSIAVQAG